MLIKKKLFTSIKSYNLCLETASKKNSKELISFLKIKSPSPIALSSSKNLEQIVKVAWGDLVNKSKTLLEILSGKLKPKKITKHEQSHAGTSELTKEEILESSKAIKKLQKDKGLKPGLYFILLIDLVGSTYAASQMDANDNIRRIRQFITFTKQSINKKSRNKIKYLVQQKDASLIIFSNFDDILDWFKKITKLLQKYNEMCDITRRSKVYKMEYKIAIHAGEVHFEIEDPIALAVDQVFKIEKNLVANNFAISDRVREIIRNRINGGKIHSNKIMDLDLIGEENSRPLWNITIISK